MPAFVKGSGNLSSASQLGTVYAASPIDKSDLESQEWDSKIKEVSTYFIGDAEVPLVEGTVIISFTADGWDSHSSIEEAKATGRRFNRFSVRHGLDFNTLELWALRQEVWQ